MDLHDAGEAVALADRGPLRAHNRPAVGPTAVQPRGESGAAAQPSEHGILEEEQPVRPRELVEQSHVPAVLGRCAVAILGR